MTRRNVAYDGLNYLELIWVPSRGNNPEDVRRANKPWAAAGSNTCPIAAISSTT